MSRLALTYFELDLPKCSLDYGTLPCRAAREGSEYVAINDTDGNPIDWNFADGTSSLHGWTLNDFSTGTPSLVGGPDGAVYDNNSAADGGMQVSVEYQVGSNKRMRIRIEGVSGSGTPVGTVFFLGADWYYAKGFNFPAIGTTAIVDMDLSSGVTGPGGSNPSPPSFASSTFIALRIDIPDDGGTSTNVYKIKDVQIVELADADTATGTQKCFKTKRTCQSRQNFTEETVTVRFAVDAAYLPQEIDCIPCILGVDLSPAILNPGVDLGKRGSVSVTLSDQRFSDTGPIGDPYLSSRSYSIEPYYQGTFFGKFRARHFYVHACKARLRRGFVGQSLEEMETRHYIVESLDGPNAEGRFTITAKDPLKLADADRAQVPLPSEGYVSAEVTETAAQITLLPSGIGASYPASSGYAALGGKEVVAFAHDPYGGLNAATKLLFHFDGDDGSTTITDSSGNGRNGTCNGNAQIDTADAKFGRSSLLLDGTGDYVTVADNADWQFSGTDFTIDCWIKLNTLAPSLQCICGHSTDSANAFYLIIYTTGDIICQVYEAGVATVDIGSITAPIQAGQWHHVALTRTGTSWYLWVDGVQVSALSDASTIPNFTGALHIGIAGDATNFPFNGRIAAFRIQHEAFWTADFSDALPGPYASTPDTFFIQRAKWNTEAVTHSAEARFQQCKLYSAQTPAAIINDIAVNYCNIDPAYITPADWVLESNTYFGALLTTLIAEPTAGVKLINEIIEQCGLSVWWDDINQQIRFKVLQPVPDSATIWDKHLQMKDTLSIKDQPDKRVSQSWVYFARINPLRPIDEVDNYRSVAVTADLESQTNYGSPAIKKIHSRWIATGGMTTAVRVNQLQIARYKDGPRRVAVSLFRDGVQQPALGGFAQLKAPFIQDDTGAEVAMPIQITRVGPESHCYRIEAEEFNFDRTLVDFLSDDNTVTIDSDINNVNFRELFNQLYPEPESGETVRCIIRSGVVVGSSSTSLNAFEVGTWPGGVTVEVEVNGTIAGAGGAGGNGGAFSPTSGSDGQPGGVALYTRQAINLMGAGTIGGGGGGGGGGGSNSLGGAGAGGGGRGRVGGSGGLGQNGYYTRGNDGSPGLITTAGAGGAGKPGNSGDGGNGGDLGAAGSNGQSFGGGAGGSGGAAGNAIDGVSYVTETGSLSILGAEVN